MNGDDEVVKKMRESIRRSGILRSGIAYEEISEEAARKRREARGDDFLGIIMLVKALEQEN